jgi:hypothetical protein
MDVKLSELRAAIDKIFVHLEETERTIVPIPHDYYWWIPKETVYNPYSQPSEMDLGQLSDDLAELNRIANGEAEPHSYALVWVASLLRAIGEETVD